MELRKELLPDCLFLRKCRKVELCISLWERCAQFKCQRKREFFTLCIFVFVYLTLRKVCRVRKSKQKGILLLGLFPIWEPPLFDETCISIWPRAWFWAYTTVWTRDDDAEDSEWKHTKHSLVLNKFWGKVFHEGSWWCPWQPRGNICCFIPSVSLRRSGPGSLRLIRHFIRSHHTLIIQNNAQSKKMQSFKVIYNKDQYNTMLKDNVHGQKVKSCTIEINTIQNAQRCPGARSKWSFSQRGSNVSASACFVCCV